MFVSIVCELTNDDHRRDLHHLFRQYGFKQVFQGVYESTSVQEGTLPRLKRDIDRRTDSYDRVRLYQYPMESTLVITSLQNKRWRRFVLRDQA